MRRLVPAVIILSGCGVQLIDPCSSVKGTCLTVQIDPSTVTEVDALMLHVAGYPDHTAVSPRPLTLPVAVALAFDRVTTGSASIDVTATGSLHAAQLGRGHVQTTITAGQHKTVHMTLTGQRGGGDLGGLGSDGFGGDGFGEGDAAPSPDLYGSYAVSVSVSGLLGGVLTLANNGGDNLSISNSGVFTFATPIPNGSTYDVTVVAQPQLPAQTCSVASPSGSSAAGNVQLLVTCQPSLVSRFAFVVSSDYTVFTYAVDAATGRLRAVRYGYALGGTAPKAIAVDPAGKFAVITSSSGVTSFKLDSASGVLTSSGPPKTDGANAGLVTFHPSGKFVAAVYEGDNISVDSSVSIYAVDPSTGALTGVGGIGNGQNFSPSAVAFTPSGKLLYVVDGSIGGIGAYLVDVTGALTRSGAAVLPNANRVAIDPTGRFAYATTSDNTLVAYAIDGNLGTLTQIAAPLPTSNLATGIVVSPAGRVVYVTNSTDNTIGVYAIDQTTGALTKSGTVTTPGGLMTELSLDATGQFAYVTDGAHLWIYAVNVTSGALSLAGGANLRSGSTVPVFSQGTQPVSFVSKFAYVTNAADNNVSVYKIAPDTGALTSVGNPVAAGTAPARAAVDRSGQFLYVANSGSNNVSMFSINSTTGALTSLGTAVATGKAPQAIALEPSGRYAYVLNASDGNISPFSINQTTGVLTSAGSTVAAGSSPPTLEVAPDGLIACGTTTPNGITRFSINGQTGAMVSGPSVVTGTYPVAALFDPSGRFYYTGNNGSNNVSAFTIDPTNNSLSSLGMPLNVAGSPDAIAIDPLGRFLYVSSGDVAIFTLSPLTGMATNVPPDVSVGGNSFLAVDPAAKFLYRTNSEANNVRIFAIDQATGKLTQVGNDVATGMSPSSIAIAGGMQ